MDPITERVTALCGQAGCRAMIDRGEGLYAVVAGGPSGAAADAALAEALSREGFACFYRGRTLVVSPEPVWRAPFERWITAWAIPGVLSEDFLRFGARRVTGAERACWIAGLKRLRWADEGDYERRLRGAAAVALREGGGGLLRACALCLDGIRQSSQRIKKED